MLQPDNTEIPAYLARKLAGLCTRCGRPATDDAQLCSPHLEDQRSRARDAMRKRRRERRKNRRCAECGRKAQRFRCPRCYQKSAGVNKPQDGVNKPAGLWRVEADPRPERAGQSTPRYIGRGRRGRLTREQQIDEDMRDARFAIKELEKFIEKATVLKEPAAMELPRIQRDAVRRDAGQHPAFAARIADDLTERYG